METSATKRQTLAEDKMATTENSYFLHELELRREHLLSASRANIADQSLSSLLASVDAALFPSFNVAHSGFARPAKGPSKRTACCATRC